MGFDGSGIALVSRVEDWVRANELDEVDQCVYLALMQAVSMPLLQFDFNLCSLLISHVSAVVGVGWHAC